MCQLNWRLDNESPARKVRAGRFQTTGRQTLQATIDYYNEEKGFGFATCNGERHFFHINTGLVWRRYSFFYQWGRPSKNDNIVEHLTPGNTIEVIQIGENKRGKVLDSWGLPRPKNMELKAFFVFNRTEKREDGEPVADSGLGWVRHTTITHSLLPVLFTTNPEEAEEYVKNSEFVVYAADFTSDTPTRYIEINSDLALKFFSK